MDGYVLALFTFVEPPQKVGKVLKSAISMSINGTSVQVRLSFSPCIGEGLNLQLDIDSLNTLFVGVLFSLISQGLKLLSPLIRVGLVKPLIHKGLVFSPCIRVVLVFLLLYKVVVTSPCIHPSSKLSSHGSIYISIRHGSYSCRISGHIYLNVLINLTSVASKRRTP